MKYVIALCFVLLVLAGCEKAAEKQMEAKIEAETGGNADVDINKGDMTIKTDEGTVEVTGIEGATPGDWCKEGAEWKFTSAETAQQDVSAKWIIKGMGSGEYSGLCHVVYTMQSSQGTVDMDYYFAKDGKSGYAVIKLPNGQTMKQEWKG